MNFAQTVRERSGGVCELCQSKSNPQVYQVLPLRDSLPEEALMLCDGCLAQVSAQKNLDANHWHCLNESMWSEVAAVKVLSWRLLKQLSGENWARDLMDQIYLEDDLLAWAKAGVAINTETKENSIVTKDSNGTPLLEGDSVTLIKDLEVKGANFTAKRGTLVKNIALTSNPEQIEGRVNGTQIVLLTRFLKKA